MFKTKFSRMRKSWVLGFILLMCIGLIVISQLTFPQQQKKLKAPVGRLWATHELEKLCNKDQRLNVRVFQIHWTTCQRIWVKGAKVRLIHACDEIAKGTTNEDGVAHIPFHAKCLPKHCYMTVRVEKFVPNDPTIPYYGAVLLLEPTKNP